MKITITTILSMLLSVAAYAETSSFIVDVNTKKLYVYDDNGEEVAEIKGDSIKSDFVAIPGQDKSGLAIAQENADEGLLQVRLSQFPDPVWLETMSVEVWPTGRLKCPEVTVGRSEIEQSGMTIGFGEHCEPSETQE